MTHLKDHALSEQFLAIVACAGRFPGAPDVDAFWRLLLDGGEPLHHFSDEELLAAGLPQALIDHPSAVKSAMRLDGAELFDAEFFGYTPGQAAAIHPQQRAFLELAWEALERAGRTPESLDGRIGVFAGASATPAQAPPLGGERLPPGLDVQGLIDSGPDFIATRVSYKLDLHGPSLSIQTACSSSLVAVHTACQSLLNYECDLALAGGASIPALQAGYLHQKGGILSPDGRCRAFDASAVGTIPGRGAAVVALRRLADAVADGDPICAVIRATATNNDGARKVGYTAPAVDGQVGVISTALALAGVEPAEVGLIEGHGTGTVLGDNIELTALHEVFEGAPKGQCVLGSVKTNIGHLDAAAGVTGLIKAALCLQNRSFVPTLHFQTPNEAFAAASPFRVTTAPAPWTAETPRIAGVSSFGIGGTNAHAVLQEYVPALRAPPAERPRIFPLSAKTPEALERARLRLRAHLTDASDADLRDVAFTLQRGRSVFACRWAAVAESREALIAQLAGAVIPAASPEGLRLSALAQAWVSTGQTDWDNTHPESEARRTVLPTYAFDRRPCVAVAPQGLRAPSLFGSAAKIAGAPVELKRLEAIARELVDADGRVDLAQLVASLESTPHEPPATADQPLTELEQAVMRIWAGALGLAEVGLDESFFDIGGDSLNGVAIIEQLEEMLGIEIEIVALLNSDATVRALAAYLAKQVAAVIAAGEPVSAMPEPAL